MLRARHVANRAAPSAGARMGDTATIAQAMAEIERLRAVEAAAKAWAAVRFSITTRTELLDAERALRDAVRGVR
jgi:hypothetical protein